MKLSKLCTSIGELNTEAIKFFSFSFYNLMKLSKLCTSIGEYYKKSEIQPRMHKNTFHCFVKKYAKSASPNQYMYLPTVVVLAVEK